MRCVKINLSSSYIEYDDGKDFWNADILYVYNEEEKKKEIQIVGKTRILTDEERNNIITELLNTFAFGNYLQNEHELWLCKLKNRRLEKKVELGLENEMSYSIIGEEVLELSENVNDCEIVKVLRELYLNLRIQAVEYKNNLKSKIITNHKTPWNSISFNFEGSRNEYKTICKILNSIKYEFEDALSKHINHKILIDIEKSKIANRKATIQIQFKEAN